MKQLTTELAWTIFGIILIVATAGGMAYGILFMTKPTALEPAASSYNVGIITNELKKVPDSANVFIRMSKLGQPVPQSVQIVTYQEGDLGKSNIAQIGQ